MTRSTVTQKCSCGARLHQAGWIPEAAYITNPGRRGQKSWCCQWCAHGWGCLCSVWTQPASTKRLDTLLDKIDGGTR